MIRAGYFCTGGHTELGARALAVGGHEVAAIHAFLSKISPSIAFRRAFPAVEKPGPKPGRARTSFKDPTDGGVTGARLVERMLERLAKHYRGDACDLDVVVLIDDADCRFLEEGTFERWSDGLTRDVRASTEQPALCFVPLLASPEIESWLLSDWEQGFGLEYRAIEVKLIRALARDEMLGSRPWITIERFGGKHVNGSCERKLSDAINQVLDAIAMEEEAPVERRSFAYSKRDNGPDMLRRIRPEKVAEVAGIWFRPAYHQLVNLALVAEVLES